MSAKYYTMEFIINDIVYVSLREKIESLLIDAKGGHFKVKGHDHIGLWVEHPGLEYDIDSYFLALESFSGSEVYTPST